MRRFFCLFAVVALAAGAPAFAQSLPPACPADLPPGRALHLPPWRLAVLADSAFLAMRVASQDFDTVTARVRLQVQPSGAVELLCVYGPGSAASPLAGAARLLRFGREYDRRFRDTATVDVTLAVSRPLDGAPVYQVARRVTVGPGVRVELAQLAIERSAARFSRGEQVAIYRAALESVRSHEREGTSVRCVVFTRGGGPDREVAALLDRPGRRVVAAGACPPTRFHGGVGADYSTVPPGSVDPYRFEVGPMDAWSPDTAAFNLVTRQSTDSSGHVCVVVREAGAWRAQCREEWSRRV